MAYRLQFRKDTEENWISVNPQLADGEIGLIRGTNLYKIGCPWTQEDISKAIEDNKYTEENAPSVGSLKFWKDLPLYGFDGTLSHNLIKDENSVNEAVNKSVLVEKFASIDEMLSHVDLEDDTSALKSLLNDLSTRVGTTEGNIDNINTNIGTIEDNVGNIQKELDGYKPEEGDPVIGIKEKVVGIEEKVEILENRIQVISASEWDNLLSNPSMINEGVLYYTYEE